jgi:hypothetical protein
MKDLKIVLDAPSNYDLKDEQAFIYRYGQFRCRKLKFRGVDEIIKIMDAFDPNCLTKENKKFILGNSNKEVLCHISHTWEDNPDIFVYGDDNIAFRKECFV